MLDQAEEIGPGRSQRAANVVFGEPFQLPDHRLSHIAQVAVQVLLREVIHHGYESVTDVFRRTERWRCPMVSVLVYS